VIEIRPVSAVDAEDCARIARDGIWILAASCYTEAQRRAWQARFDGPMMAERMDGCFAVGAWSGDALAGFGILSPALAEIGYVYSDPAFQGHGAGTAIMAALVGEARRLGLARLSLTSSLNAVEFYERLGFVRGESGVRSIGCESLPCIRMSISLD
jgi:GNAT superfamily N-acetyltransferase